MEYVICTWNISVIGLSIISSQLHASCMTLSVMILKVLYFCILLLECSVVVLVSWFCPRCPFLFWFCWPIILAHWAWAIGACCSYHLVPLLFGYTPGRWNLSHVCNVDSITCALTQTLKILLCSYILCALFEVSSKPAVNRKISQYEWRCSHRGLWMQPFI